jgi:hypothetical protein
MSKIIDSIFDKIYENQKSSHIYIFWTKETFHHKI